MAKCPYCNNELHLEDFFHITSKETKKGKIKVKIGDFKGEQLEQGIPRVQGKRFLRMWVCPSCDKILSFTVSGYAWR